MEYLVPTCNEWTKLLDKNKQTAKINQNKQAAFICKNYAKSLFISRIRQWKSSCTNINHFVLTITMITQRISVKSK